MTKQSGCSEQRQRQMLGDDSGIGEGVGARGEGTLISEKRVERDPLRLYVGL